MSSYNFYKFYTINQNLYSSIINNELYFSNPRNFNDPFDSYPRIIITEDTERLELFFNYLKSKIITLKTSIISNIKDQEKLQLYTHSIFVYNELNLFDEELYTYEIDNVKEKLIELFAFYSKNENFENLVKKNMTFLQEKMYYDYIFLTIDNQNYGISCGSEKANCPLMWGHYANNHKGICIKYEIDNKVTVFDKNKQFDILKVKYSDNPINVFEYSFEELDNLKFEILTNKYSKWQYENEIRLINRGQGLFKINIESISEIIFGCKSSPKDRYSILKLFASLGYKVENLKMARRLPNQYELSIQEMKINDIAGSGVYIEELNTNKNFL